MDDYNDISTIDQYHQARDRGFSHETALGICNTFSRDNARTPMQWSAEKGAGFTTGKPWLVINPNHREINVESQQKDSMSVLNYYKKLLHFRKNEEYADALVDGEFVPAYEYMQEEQKKIFAFYRQGESHRFLVISNWDERDVTILVPQNDSIVKKHLDSMSTNEWQEEQNSLVDEISLVPGQICIYELQGN